MVIKFITRTEGNEVFVDYSCDKKLVSSQETTRPLSVIAAALNRIEQQPLIITSIVVVTMAIDNPSEN